MASFLVKTASLAGAVALALCATFVQAQTESSAPQECKPVLGIVTPAKTTLGEAAAALKQKGCEYKEENVPNQGRKITVGPGCFQLLGDPRVIFVGPADDQPVGNVWLEFAPGVDGATYQRYLDTLQKSYGDPTATGFDSGMNYALWNSTGRHLMIVLVGNQEAGPRLVNYYIGDLATKLWEEFQKTHATSDKDMDTL